MPYRIVYYKDRKGKQPVKDFIDDLASSSSKDARINLNKVRITSNTLQRSGLKEVNHT